MKITKEQLKKMIKEEIASVSESYNDEMEKIYGDEAMAQRHADQSSAEGDLKAAFAELQSLLKYANVERMGMPAALAPIAQELQANVAKAKAVLASLKEQKTK